MRVFKVKVFARFQRREKITDEVLEKTIREAERGLIEADLGDGLIKQRVARPGQGKRSSYRTVIVYRRGDLAVYLLGFAKKDQANIDEDELETLKGQARTFLKLNPTQFESAVAEDELVEIDYADEE